MTLQETIHQVTAEICEDRKQIAHTRLESITGVENLYSLMQVFGRGHQVTCNGATVLVTRCQATDVLPRTHTNCTCEIPAILNGTNVFADPISFVINAKKKTKKKVDDRILAGVEIPSPGNKPAFEEKPAGLEKQAARLLFRLGGISSC